MNDGLELRITPEASPEDREAILAAVRTTLDREAEFARPPAWRLSGWINQRAGVRDLSRSIPAPRLWPASARMPWGGREFGGLIGRGDAR